MYYSVQILIRHFPSCLEDRTPIIGENVNNSDWPLTVCSMCSILKCVVCSKRVTYSHQSMKRQRGGKYWGLGSPSLVFITPWSHHCEVLLSAQDSFRLGCASGKWELLQRRRGKRRGMLSCHEGPIKMMARSLFFPCGSVCPVSAEQNPGKHKFSSQQNSSPAET